MPLRFRRSIKVFPGVRLNLSRSGISTTVGVRGATMTVGHHAAHVNFGLPGTGVSYRTKIAGGEGAHQPKKTASRKAEHSKVSTSPDPVEHASRRRKVEARAAILADAHEIRSADVGALTNPGPPRAATDVSTDPAAAKADPRNVVIGLIVLMLGLFGLVAGVIWAFHQR